MAETRLDGDAFVTDQRALTEVATALERACAGVGLKTQVMPFLRP
jgi:hypothetical protein